MLLLPSNVSLTSVSPGSSVQYRPALDGLRGVAVLSVFIFHLKHQWLSGGFVGVDIFFVISGYLITSILLREYEHESFSLAKFYQRRIARLLPAFVAVALATLIGAFLIYSDQDLASSGANLVAASLSVANMKYMWQGSYFTLSPDAQPFLHYWSLSVEEQFYLFFPVAFVFLFLRANRYKTMILAVLCVASLLAGAALTRTKPDWAFFLLPTRAWELLAGSIIANVSARQLPSDPRKLRVLLPLTGLTLIFTSLFVINEVAPFPGYLAILPVLGTACFIGLNNGSGGLSERLLSARPMVVIGRMSYSLYLCHWPIFSLVDYKFYLASFWVRIALKVALSVLATALCFLLIENPGRVFFNHPRRRLSAFAVLGCALLVLVPLGTIVRKTYYVDAGTKGIAQGGLAFNQAGKNGSMILMGDSNGSMYGEMAKGIAYELGLKLNVISVAAGDPLPHSSGKPSPLWRDSLAAVKRKKPDFLILICSWRSKLIGDSGRLEIAISELKRHTGRLILVTQPPELPVLASREAMRNGSRPPFIEDPAERTERMESNVFVKSFQGKDVLVVDIESLFSRSDGSILFTDKEGKQLYQDSNHLSGVGADLVKTNVLKVITGSKTGS